MNKDVCVGFPSYDGKAEVKTIEELVLSVNHRESCIGYVQYLLGDSLVTRARNRIVQMFLKTDYEYLMFIDSDIKFSFRQVNRLRSHGKPIVGGTYLKKKLPYAPVSNTLLAKEGDLYVMGELGTGFLMIHRDVFKDIREKYPEHAYKPENDEPKGDYYDYFQVGVYKGRYLSEDYFFCRLAQECGHKIYLDPDILVDHVGKAVYPFPDEQLIDGAAELIMNHSLSRELKIDNLKKAIEFQENERNNLKESDR